MTAAVTILRLIITFGLLIWSPLSFGQTLFFRWGPLEVNEEIRQESGFPGEAYRPEGLPDDSAQGLLNASVIKIFHDNYRNYAGQNPRGFAQGPGMYVSTSPTNSRRYGNELLIFEASRDIGDLLKEQNQDPNSHKNAIAQFKAGEIDKLPLVSGIEGTYVAIRRAPLPEEGLVIRVRQPGKSDAKKMLAEISKLPLREFLEITDEIAREAGRQTKDLVKPLARPTKKFFDTYFFGYAIPYLANERQSIVDRIDNPNLLFALNKIFEVAASSVPRSPHIKGLANLMVQAHVKTGMWMFSESDFKNLEPHLSVDDLKELFDAANKVESRTVQNRGDAFASLILAMAKKNPQRRIPPEAQGLMDRIRVEMKAKNALMRNWMTLDELWKLAGLPHEAAEILQTHATEENLKSMNARSFIAAFEELLLKGRADALPLAELALNRFAASENLQTSERKSISCFLIAAAAKNKFLRDPIVHTLNGPMARHFASQNRPGDWMYSAIVEPQVVKWPKLESPEFEEIVSVASAHLPYYFETLVRYVEDHRDPRLAKRFYNAAGNQCRALFIH